MAKKTYAGWYKNKETKEIHFMDFEDRTLAEIKDRRRGNNSTLICYFENTNGHLSTGTLMICSYVLIETGNNRYTINGYNIETKESYTGMLVYDYVHVIKRY